MGGQPPNPRQEGCCTSFSAISRLNEEGIMKKMIGLALITVLLAIVFIYPGIARALTNMDGFSPTSSAIPGNESFPAASASSFFDMFPPYIWIIFAVIILIIVILTLFLVLSPGKKKKGGMPQQDRGGKPGKGEKGRKPRPEATPQPFAPAPHTEEYNPNAMPPQGRMPRPVAGQPLSPRPMPRPMPQAQFEPQPAASFEKRPPQPQPT